MAFEFKNYYDKNKMTINQRRRDRYAEDKVYRKKARKAAQDYWDKNKPPPSDQTIIQNDGMTLKTIGHAARAAGRSVCTIRQYHQTGVIPEPTYYDHRGWRLYTVAQIKLLARLLKGKLTLAEVKKELAKKW